jgi:hypothetical protein
MLVVLALANSNLCVVDEEQQVFIVGSLDYSWGVL